MSETQTLEIIDALQSLPTEKVAEVRDFVMFLRERYGDKEKAGTIDYSNEWSDEDLMDFSADTFRSLEQAESESNK